MKIITSLFAGLLFFLLTPNILLRLPKNGTKYTVAAVHAAVFTLAIYLLNLLLEPLLHSLNVKEGVDVVYYTTDKCLDEDEDVNGTFMKDLDGKCVPRPNSSTETSATTETTGKM